MPDQRKISIGNKYENLDETIEFILPEEFDSYNKYVISVIKVNGEKITSVLPINGNIFYVSTQLTSYSGKWNMYVMCRENTVLDLETEPVDLSAKNGEHVFISDGIIGVVASSEIERDNVEHLALDSNLQIVYDDLLTLKKELEEKIQAPTPWSKLVDIPSEFNPAPHNHNDLYYTKEEADIKLDKTMTGVTGYSFQYNASIVSDEKHNYFPVTKAQADSIDVGSYVSVGMQYVNGTSAATDRADGAVHKYAFDRKVLKKEVLDDNNVAIYIDCEPFATAQTVSGSVTLNCVISSMHYWSGFSDNVKGRTGCPCPTTAGLTNRHFPIVFNGIEMQVGLYEVEAGFSIYTEANTTQELYSLTDASKATSSLKQNQAGYKKITTLKSTNNNSWNYISEFGFENGCVVATQCGVSGTGDTKGVGDGIYISTGNVGDTRELLCLGGLGGWGPCGLLFLSLDDWLGSYWWDIGGRLSLNAVVEG